MGCDVGAEDGDCIVGEGDVSGSEAGFEGEWKHLTSIFFQRVKLQIITTQKGKLELQ